MDQQGKQFVPFMVPAGKGAAETQTWAARQFQDLGRDSGEKERKIEAVLDFCLQNLVAAAYGAISFDGAEADVDLGAGWQAMDHMTTVQVIPRNITVAAPGVFTFDYPGVYQLVVGFDLDHDASNTGRETSLRAFNITEGSAGATLATVGIGRNVETTNFNGVFLVEITEPDTGDQYRVDVGGGDVIGDVVWRSQSISLNAVSEWRGPDPLGRG